MGLGGGIGRVVGLPLLILNTIFAIIILGFSAHFLDKIIARKFSLLPNRNPASEYFVQLALLSSVLCLASYVTAAHHLRLWRSDTGGAAQSSAWIAWFVLVLAFALAWKEIHIGHRPVKVRVAEAFVIILTVTHFIWAVLSHLGHKTDGTTAGTPHHKPVNPNAPAAASAV